MASRQIALIYRKSRKQARTVHAFLEVLRSIYGLELPASSTKGQAAR